MILRKTKLNKGEIIPISFDFMFTEIFNKEENIDIVESFLSSYFDIHINKIKGNVKILKRKQKIENKTEKNKEVDLLLEINNEKINIELNNYVNQGIIDRNVVFASKVHVTNLKYAENNYNNINKTIQINLNNKPCNEEKLIETYYLTNEKGKVLTKKLQIDQIDMEKAKEICYNKSVSERERKIARWCMIINSKTIDSLIKNIGEDIMSEDTKDKLVENVEELSGDDEAVYLYTKLSHDEIVKNTLIDDAKKEGFKNGINEGIEKGIEKGVEKGIYQVAKKLLSMNINMEDISKATGLSTEQIQNL